MLQAKCESDGTSTPPKSPSSPKQQPLYYVLSPPHDSNYDDNKSSPPQTSPLSTSPMDSPSHPSRHSHSSSSSRVSGFSRKWNRKRGWNECSVIKEEEEYDCVYCDYERCKCLIAVMGLTMLFTLFCLIIWGASRPYQPRVSVKSLTVYNFYSGQGSDYTGVPTKMLTVNCSVKMSIYNPATFFGIHFRSTAVNLIFTEITVATGQLKIYYLPSKGHRIVDVNMEGQRVPLYGAGASLPMSNNNRKVPLRLDFEIVSQGNVVGKLVKTKHKRHLSCSLVVDSTNTKVINFEENSCTND